VGRRRRVAFPYDAIVGLEPNNEPLRDRTRTECKPPGRIFLAQLYRFEVNGIDDHNALLRRKRLVRLLAEPAEHVTLMRHTGR
jgi:hypothetical protein